MSSNCRFIRANTNKARQQKLGDSFPHIINGDGAYAGAPARVEDPAFPMDNVLLAGRKGNVWAVPQGFLAPNWLSTDIVLEIDLGGQTPITAMGLLGTIRPPNTTFPTQALVECIPGTDTYNAAGYVTQNGQAPVMFLVTRDGGAVVAPVTARYWRFRFPLATSGKGLAVAGAVLATAVTDIGFLYSGASETRVRPRTLVESYDQSPMLTYVGPEHARWAIEFNNNDAALRTTLDLLYGDVQPFVFITPDNKWQECVWATEEFERSHIWSPPDRYRMTVELRQLT